MQCRLNLILQLDLLPGQRIMPLVMLVMLVMLVVLVVLVALVALVRLVRLAGLRHGMGLLDEAVHAFAFEEA